MRCMLAPMLGEATPQAAVPSALSAVVGSQPCHAKQLDMKPGRLLQVDGCNVVVEVDGPAHFLATPPFQPAGRTLLRNRLLAAGAHARAHYHLDLTVRASADWRPNQFMLFMGTEA